MRGEHSCFGNNQTVWNEIYLIAMERIKSEQASYTEAIIG